MKFNKLILSIFLLAYITPLVSAACIVEQQGDPVYLGEYCDVSRVVSWQTQFAYFSNGRYSDSPTKIVDASGYMYRYYIDPAKFVVGIWYKWDNIYEPAGNSVAFEVRSGRRPNVTTNVTPNATGNITNKTGPQAVVIPKETGIILARGDYGELKYGLVGSDRNITDDSQPGAYIWLFGTAGVTTKILGVKLDYTNLSLGYTYKFMPEDTELLALGRYKGYYQFVGKNGRQDVFYDSVNNTLDSPYKQVNPVNLDPFIPERIQQEFETLSKPSEFSDDILVPITMEVMDPDVVILDYWEESDNIFIQGTTSMGAGTILVMEINPDNYALANEVEANKKRTTAQGPSGELRKFSASVPVKWDELSIGVHKLRVVIEAYKIKVSMDKDFQVSGIWVMPTPTPELRKVIIVKGASEGSHLVGPNGTNINSSFTEIDTFGITPTPTPTLTVAYTPTPTPKPTNKPKNVTVTPTPKPTPTDDVVIPLNPLLVIGAVIATGLIIRRRRE